MNELGRAVTALRLSCGLTVVLALSACDQKNETQSAAGNAPGTARNAAPASIPMGGNKSVTRFFVTSKGLRKRRRPRGSRGSRCALPSSGTSPRRGDKFLRFLALRVTTGLKIPGAQFSPRPKRLLKARGTEGTAICTRPRGRDPGRRPGTTGSSGLPP
jgi:hypothetical protein